MLDLRIQFLLNNTETCKKIIQNFEMPFIAVVLEVSDRYVNKITIFITKR